MVNWLIRNYWSFSRSCKTSVDYRSNSTEDYRSKTTEDLDLFLFEVVLCVYIHTYICFYLRSWRSKTSNKKIKAYMLDIQWCSAIKKLWREAMMSCPEKLPRFS
jgi:hypothetical protein